jgi:hypothetical protein
MNSSLSNLSKKIVKWEYIPDEFEDLRSKQFFPYSYFTDTNVHIYYKLRLKI